jgi:hypothetical protein
MNKSDATSAIKTEEEKVSSNTSLLNSPEEKKLKNTIKNVSNFILNEKLEKLGLSDKNVIQVNLKSFVKDNIIHNELNAGGLGGVNFILNIHPKFLQNNSQRNSISIVSKNQSLIGYEENNNLNLNLNLLNSTDISKNNKLKSDTNINESHRTNAVNKIKMNTSASAEMFITKLDFSYNSNLKGKEDKHKNNQSRNNKSSKLIPDNISYTFANSHRKQDETQKTHIIHPSNTELYKVSPILKVDHPQLHNLLNEFSKDKYNRRGAFRLTDHSEVKMFLSTVLENYNQGRLNDSYIPRPQYELILNKNSPLNKIYSKCDKEIKVASHVDKLLSKESKKIVTNSYKDNEKLKKQLDEFIYSKGDKVNSNSLVQDKKVKDKLDIIPKLSEKLAFLDREFFIKNFGYDYNKDNEFIFQEEIVKKQNQEKILIENGRKNKVKNKHLQVEFILEKGVKEKETLISKVNDDIEKNIFRHHTKNKSHFNFDENYAIDFLNVQKKEKSKYMYLDVIDKSPFGKKKSN